MKCFGLTALPPGSDFELVPVPAGKACIDCGVAIVCGDPGFILPYFGGPEAEAVYHRDCLVRCLGIGLSPPSPSGPGDGSSSGSAGPSGS